MPTPKIGEVLPPAAAWHARADELAQWAWKHLVNRTDVWGGYGSEGQLTHPAKGDRGKVLLTPELLAKHFRATDRRSIIGLHTTPPANLSKWCAADIDQHDPEGPTPEGHERAVHHWYGELRAWGFRPLLTDSNGKGGFHLRVLLREPAPTEHVFAFLRWLVGDWSEFGFTVRPECFPKQKAVAAPGKKGEYGNWLRTPGRHHKREHWPRVWDGSQWLEADAAINFMLALDGDDPALLFAPRIEAYAEKLPHLGQGQGRDDVAYNFAAFLAKDLALPDTFSLQWLSRWDAGNTPPKGATRLAEILANAHNYGRNSYGSGTNGKPRGKLRHAAGKAGASLDYPPPKEGECWNDPHRLARLYVDDRRTGAGEPSVRQWRDEFHGWNGACWLPVPDSDLDSQIAAHCRAVFEVDYPHRVEGWEKRKEQKVAGDKEVNVGDKPTIYPVTSKLKSDVKLNLGGQVNIPDRGNDAPFWLSNAEGLPAASEVISAPNGLYTLADIAAGKPAFTPPSPCFFTFNALPFAIEADPPTPQTWIRCLNEWLNGDAASILGLQEWMGYCLSSETRAHKIAFLVGPKRSGKGTVVRTLTQLIGERNVASTTFTRLGESFGLQPLLGKLLAVIPDARLSGRTDVLPVVERLLSISGEDQQSVNRKNRTILNTSLKSRFLLASNEVPALTDASGALASRFEIYSFPNSWLGKEDKNLDDKLRAELPGILQWACKGYVRLCCQGFQFTPNDAAERHQRELEDLGSPIRAFVRERCAVGPTAKISVRDLFLSWCEWNEYRNSVPGIEQLFGRNLSAAFPHIRVTQPRVKDVRVRFYNGIELRDRKDWGEDPPELARDGTRSLPAPVCAPSGDVCTPQE